ncbi:hypothetical protein C8A05DRAFT_17449 [Staphylotrichum tortipilum]|uniref:Protein kinase domain-containing protein n=1 Tax=Staphylotrichum tortipilum TaxID=2831512 RepID=A0AAN6MG59_9PEZI|nr:hypothetical protein C8A05DRAFT_17449 [Staphylotrichum longicolle]
MASALPPTAPGELTLAHFVATSAFYCELSATDDVLAPGEIEPEDLGEDLTPPPGSPEGDDAAAPWTTSFPSFRTTEVAVICEDPADPFDSNRSRVRIDEQELTLLQGLGSDAELLKRDIAVFEKIAAAKFEPEVRTDRVYGIVRNEKDHLVGYLLYVTEKRKPLIFALGRKTPEDVKERWAEQIRFTLTALHEAGIAWGNAIPHNVLIDKPGDAWIVGLMRGHGKGEVDTGKEETMERDREGLDGILEFIDRGGDEDLQAFFWSYGED